MKKGAKSLLRNVIGATLPLRGSWHLFLLSFYGRAKLAEYLFRSFLNSRGPPMRRLLLFAIVCLPGSSMAAQLVVRHSGANDPINEQWTEGGTFSQHPSPRVTITHYKPSRISRTMRKCNPHHTIPQLRVNHTIVTRTVDGAVKIFHKRLNLFTLDQ